jgi:Flp pilus assembly protein TadD
LAETKVVEVPTTIASAKQSAEESKQTKGAAEAATPDASQIFQQKKLDERSERMFREQWERGLRAFEEGNYKQAVHFLSIAAAIHPENQEIREKLREARERKRQQDEASR